jgi:hypothetical protein
MRRLAGQGGSEDGAALLMALIFITVVAVVIGAVLTFVDASMRTTVTVRKQAASAAAADGAAQVAINTLRKGTYQAGGTGSCFDTANNLPLGGFYPLAGTSGYSANVTCEVDTTDSGSGGLSINSNNKPGTAILSLGTDPTEDGVNISGNGHRTVLIHGRVYSNTNIVGDQIQTNGEVRARTGCTGTVTSTSTTVPAKDCLVTATTDTKFNDPGYDAPDTADTTNRDKDIPACKDNKVMEFQPGLYTSLSKLNNLTNGCDGTFHFNPGVYFFDLSGVWVLGTGSLVGGKGTPGEVVDGHEPKMPGSCLPPIPPDPPGSWTNPGPNAGVEFVFAGTTQLYLNKGRMELCGTYSTTHPPIAIYGLGHDIGAVNKQSGCILIVGGKKACDMITSDNSPRSQMFVQGTTYAPKARINIQLNNSTGQVFRYGVIARSIQVGATGSADLGGAVIEVPDDSPGGPARTVLLLKVFVCKGAAACATTGNPQLTAKIIINDPSGAAVAGAREVTVYSWSIQR